MTAGEGLGFFGVTPVPIDREITLAHHCRRLNSDIERLTAERDALMVELDVAYAALAALNSHRNT